MTNDRILLYAFTHVYAVYLLASGAIDLLVVSLTTSATRNNFVSHFFVSFITDF